MLSNQMPALRKDLIPKVIFIQNDTITMRNKKVKECDVMSHCDETGDIRISQTSYKSDETAESQFNGGVVSLTSEISSLSSEISIDEELHDILPLDYRIEWSIGENTSLINCILQNESIFKNDITSMEVDSFCAKSNHWEIQSIYEDSRNTEEDISTIPEWINGSEDVWKH